VGLEERGALTKGSRSWSQKKLLQYYSKKMLSYGSASGFGGGRRREGGFCGTKGQGPTQKSLRRRLLLDYYAGG